MEQEVKHRKQAHETASTADDSSDSYCTSRVVVSRINDGESPTPIDEKGEGDCGDDEFLIPPKM